MLRSDPGSELQTLHPKLEQSTYVKSTVWSRVFQYKSIDVSQERITSIFKVEEYANQETDMEQVIMLA
jgi:hypothetical protein